MFKIIACILLTISYLFNLYIKYRSFKARNNKVPEELNDVYNERNYKEWKSYSCEHIILDIVVSSINYVVTLALLLTNVFSIIVSKIDNIYLSSILVILIYDTIQTVIDTIESYVYKMKIEEKYGFNKTKIKTFVSDTIKSTILSFIILGALSALFAYIYESLGDYILILLTGIIFVFILFVSFLYPVFSKMNNKFTSLEEGELRTKLISLLERHGYHVRDIKVMDASRRTTKSNAYFTGFGKMKTIVLYDNLLKNVTEDEVVAIFAHEMGHGLHKDTLKNSFLSLIEVFLLVLSLWSLVKYPDICRNFGFDKVNYGFVVLLVLAVIMPIINVLFNLLSSSLSRRHEYAADKQAVLEGYGKELISALKALNKENFSAINPDPIVVALTYSHPTLLERIRNINKIEQELERK